MDQLRELKKLSQRLNEFSNNKKMIEWLISQSQMIGSKNSFLIDWYNQIYREIEEVPDPEFIGPPWRKTNPNFKNHPYLRVIQSLISELTKCYHGKTNGVEADREITKHLKYIEEQTVLVDAGKTNDADEPNSSKKKPVETVYDLAAKHANKHHEKSLDAIREEFQITESTKTWKLKANIKILPRRRGRKTAPK